MESRVFGPGNVCHKCRNYAERTYRVIVKEDTFTDGEMALCPECIEALKVWAYPERSADMGEPEKPEDPEPEKEDQEPEERAEGPERSANVDPGFAIPVKVYSGFAVPESI